MKQMDAERRTNWTRHSAHKIAAGEAQATVLAERLLRQPSHSPTESYVCHATLELGNTVENRTGRDRELVARPWHARGQGTARLAHPSQSARRPLALRNCQQVVSSRPARSLGGQDVAALRKASHVRVRPAWRCLVCRWLSMVRRGRRFESVRGLCKVPANRGFLISSICILSSMHQVWSRLWSSQISDAARPRLARAEVRR